MTRADGPSPHVVTACRRLEARLGAVASDIASDLREQEPAYAEAMSQSDLTADVYANIASLVESVRLNRILPPSTSRTTGRRRASQSIPLPTVMSAYRIGVMRLWHELVDECAGLDQEDVVDEPGSARHALLDSATVLWTGFDIHVHEIADAFHDFEVERLQQDHRRRQELLAILFSGEAGPEVSLADVAHRLGVSPTGPYVVIVSDSRGYADHLTPGRGPAPALAHHCLWRFGPRSDLGLISVRKAEDLERLVREISHLELGRVGVSRIFSNLSSVPSAAAQARLAREAGADGPQTVTQFDEVHVGNLLITSPAPAADLQRHVLEPLQRLPPGDQEVMLTTLAAWFASHGSTDTAARVLHCHPNTVRYRLNKLTAALGRDLRSPLDIVHLYLAVEARRLLKTAPVPEEPGSSPPVIGRELRVAGTRD